MHIQTGISKVTKNLFSLAGLGNSLLPDLPDLPNIPRIPGASKRYKAPAQWPRPAVWQGSDRGGTGPKSHGRFSGAGGGGSCLSTNISPDLILCTGIENIYIAISAFLIY